MATPLEVQSLDQFDSTVPPRIGYDPASQPDYALDLIQELDDADRWPTTKERPIQDRLHEWAALREGDAEEIRDLIDWPADRDYVVDPLPGKIAEAFSSLIFGKDPLLTAADQRDQDGLVALIEENQMPSELERAAEISSSEGEVWWRVFIDRDIARYPQIQFYSRRYVYPLFRYKRLLACAFVNELAPTTPHQIEVFRHMEIHSEGQVRNVLYQGTQYELGSRIPLESRSETEQLEPLWQHDIPDMLGGRIPNKIGTRPEIGISDYAPIREMLLSLNEAVTIGAENARLVAKKRLFVSASLTDAEGEFDAGSDVYQFDQLDEEAGQSSGKPPVQQVEYSFDAQSLVTYTDNLAENILTRVGIAPQLAGREVGQALSGSALRARMLHSELVAEGKARFWDDELPRMLKLMQLIDSMPEHMGGFERPWQQPALEPALQRSDTLPQDPAEEAFRHATLVGSQLESKKTAIQALHPEWSDDQVESELQEIQNEVVLETYAAIGQPVPAAAGSPTQLQTPNQQSQKTPVPGQPQQSGQDQQGQDHSQEQGQALGQLQKERGGSSIPLRTTERFMFNPPGGGRG